MSKSDKKLETFAKS